MRLLVITFILATFAIGFTQTWVARFNGVANGDDFAIDIAADNEGCVYVVGTSWSGASGNDIVIIKYSPEGETLWTRRYDGFAHGNDEARAIAVRNGRVAVTGGSADTSLFADIITLVYSTDGNLLWSKRFDSPSHGNDLGLVVVIDDGGNVYVAGYKSGDTTGWDIAVLKYDFYGQLLWETGYQTADEDYAVDLALGMNNDLFVAGNSGNPYYLTWDYVTMRVDAASGETLWTKRYNGPADEDDEAAGLVVDQQGNVYVTGGSVASASGADFTTLKYTGNGEQEWERRYNGPANGLDRARAIAIDSEGNIYVTGYSQGETSDFDYATVKYDPSGNQEWVRRYDGEASGYDEARAIATDRFGSVYVTGFSTGTGTRNDYATVGYNASGNQVWVGRYDGPAGRMDEASAIAIDSADGVFVTGSSEGQGTGYDLATIRYQAIGIEEPGHLANIETNMPVTLVRNCLYFSGKNGKLLNCSGQQVMDVNCGVNDVRGLPAGVYFLTDGGKANYQRVRLVVVK
ncbi:MAG: SBBP repeat-containing protein [candidate division WOR-3 bacterium]